MDTSLGGKQTSAFKTFPEFSKLTLKDRQKFESFTKDFPPISDISFPMLITWWNWLDSCAVSVLNGNLVIAYWFPGDDRHSGLSLIGTKYIDESICTLFDYLREKSEPVKLVHVPEFVLGSIRYPELFIPKEERNFDEYVYSVSKLYPLDQVSAFRRKRVKKFMASVGEDRISIESLDLLDGDNRRLLLEHAERWQKKGILRINNIAKNEAETMKMSIAHGGVIGLENICLFIDDELQGFSLHQFSVSKNHGTGMHVRVNPELPRVFDFMLYSFAKVLAERNIAHMNLKYDLGILPLRMLKLALGPESFFRKYTINPAE